MEFREISENKINTVVEAILPYFKEYKIWLLIGDLGSGKTTLIKKIVAELGIKEEVVSPTFGLVNEYTSRSQRIVHMDLYRLKKADEAFDIGLDEYLNSNDICFIEWPEIVMDFIKQYPFGIIKIKHRENGRDYSLELN